MEVKKLQQTEQSSSGSKDISFQSTQHVVKMLKDIPEDLRGLFTPSTKTELIQLEINLTKFGKAQEDRDYVMGLQKRFRLLFRPNMSIKETVTRAKIECIRRRNSENKYNESLYNDSDTDVTF